MDILRIVVKKRTEVDKGADKESLGRFATRVAKLRGEGPMATSEEPEVALEVVSINIKDIEIPPNYPRESVGNVESLVASIRLFGIQQPLKVVKVKGAKKYRLVFGSRRLKAAEIVGLDAVPCIVDLVTTKEDRLQMLSLVENLHRLDLHPLEEGVGYQQIDEKGTQIEELSKNLAIPKEAIFEKMEFLSLPPPIRKDIMKTPHFFSSAMLKVVLSAFRKSKNHGKKLVNAIVSKEVTSPEEAAFFVTKI